MRKSVKELVFLTDKKNEGVFKTYGEAKKVAKEIFDSYAKQRVSMQLPDGKEIKAFYPDEILRTPGVLSNIYGYTGVLSLVNRMGVKLAKAEIEELSANACWIIDELTEKGFLLTPYLTEEDNQTSQGDALFSDVYPYIGTMTWALSFLVSVRKAVLQKLIEIDDEHQQKLIDLVKLIVETFNDTCIIEDGMAKGWGYTRECENASLFFTYSVLEAFSDFEDNVMLNSVDVEMDEETGENKNDAKNNAEDRELLEAINKGKEPGAKNIEDVWGDLCKQVSKNVWDLYKEVLRDDFVDDGFMNGYKKITREDILKSNSSNALFNSIYLVFIFIYGYVNDQTQNPYVAGIDPDDVLMTMNAALQNVQRVYEQLKKDSMEYLVDTYVIPFKSKHKNPSYRDEYIRRLNTKTLLDNTLLPALVKANNMIAFYITEYPVKQMGILFKELFENMCEDEWVWESGRYDVKITERYIESIADFYMYYEKYEQFYAKRYLKNEENRESLREEEREKMRPDLLKEVEEKVAKERAEELKAKEAEIKGQYGFETMMRQIIRNEAGVMLSEAMDKTIARNMGKGEELEGFNKDFAEKFPELVFSYLLSPLYLSTTMGTDLDETQQQEVEKKLKAEADAFIEKWIQEIISTGRGINYNAAFNKEDK